MTASSCLYSGIVWHHRHRPRVHRFEYRVVMLYVDLGELPGLFAGSALWSSTRPAVVRFRRNDHLGDPSRPLEAAVRDLVEARIGRRPAGPIRLLTHPRWLGLGFNPISMYYCHEDAGAPPVAAVLEVTNTPWGERHCYVIDLRGRAWPPGGALHGRLDKAMHVSPFLPMDLEYRWTLREPSAVLAFALDCRDADTVVLSTGLRLERQELSPATMRGVLLRHPPMPLVVLGGIYWQAFRLWRKGTPYHPHPRTASDAADAQRRDIA